MKNLTLLFDLDGTLIDSTTSILAGFREAFLKFDVEYPGDKVVKDLIGYPLDYMFEKMGIVLMKCQILLMLTKQNIKKFTYTKQV